MRCKTIITTINTAIIIAVAAAAVKAFQQADDLSYFLHSNNDLLSALSYHSIYTHTFLSPFGFCLADAVATAFQFQFFFRFFLRKRQHETCASSNSMSVLSISNEIWIEIFSNDLRNCFSYFEIFYYSIMRFIVNQFSIAINKCANKCPANFERLRNNNIFPRIGDWAESAATFSNEMDVYHNTTHYVCSKVQTPKSSTFILFVFHFQTNVGFTQPTTIQWYTIWMVITSHSCSLCERSVRDENEKKNRTT